MVTRRTIPLWGWGALLLLVVSTAPSAVADSVYSVSDSTNNNGRSHAFWLPPDSGDSTPGRYYQWVESSNPTLTFTDLAGNVVAWNSEFAHNAVLAGQIEQANNANPNTPVPGGAVFDVLMHFTNGQTHAEWLAGGGTVKVENNSHANVPDWRFFELDTARPNQLALASDPSQVIPLGLFSPTGENFGLQVGIGASMKSPNNVLGASTWLDVNPGVVDPWEGSYPHGDINIELAVVPTPSAALGSTALLGLMGFRRRRRTSLS